ncbi:MAG: EI24 domain-containing protein [Rhizomicrobium sp.]
MFASLRKTVATLFGRDFVGLLFWVLVVSGLVFVGLIVGLEYVIVQLPASVPAWLKTLLEVAAPLALLLAVLALGAPVAALVGSLFLDRIAAKVDARFYPNDPKAPGAPFLGGTGERVKLIVLAVLINGAALALDAEIPFVPEAVALLANGWLLGREFFELAALRHLSSQQSDALRRRHAGKVYAGGLVIAVLTLIPGIDLIAPFFGAALMAHLFKRVTHLEGKS